MKLAKISPGEISMYMTNVYGSQKFSPILPPIFIDESLLMNLEGWEVLPPCAPSR